TGETIGETNQNTRGGMIVRGGLKLAPLIRVKPGHTLRWMQVYRETGGQGNTTIDSSGNQPLYANHTLTGFTPLFFDAPSDVFAAQTTPDKLEFQTALVCFKDNDPKKLFGLGAFQWEYDIDKVNKTIKNEKLTLTNFPTGLPLLLKNTFDAQFGANGTRDTGWTLQAGGCPDCFEVIPEPATLTLFGLGALPVWRALRRQRAAA
ncbi:MAG: PEP-CTERM sorting domain-containing protein, partial [bacterium]|nr:PEP-CTERM sorting domain-containing protein [bacterium]